jgi:hypothetical protein
MSGKQPMFNIPTSIVAAALALVALHIVRVALPPEAGIAMLLALAFIPARYAGPAMSPASSLICLYMAM